MNDIYTKAMLSVIALCLVWLCFNHVTPVASAQAEPQKVVVVGGDRPLPVIVVDQNGTSLVNVQGLRVNFGSQSQPVTLGNQTVPVAIRAIERSGTWQPIAVDVMKTPPTLQPTP